MQTTLVRTLTTLAASSALAAAELELSLEIPRLSVAEYHRPYVAIWVEGENQSVAANLAVWYDQQTSKAEKGTTWLKDLRMWWRKSGRELTLPVDGVSGATRAPGVHRIVFGASHAQLSKLPAGNYHLVVEAAREVGGREVVRLPFQWPKSGTRPNPAAGQHELGQIQLTVKP